MLVVLELYLSYEVMQTDQGPNDMWEKCKKITSAFYGLSVHQKHAVVVVKLECK